MRLAAVLTVLLVLPLAAEGPKDRIAAAGPYLTSGRPADAKVHLTKALQEFRERKDPRGEAVVLMLLGIAEVGLSNEDAARGDLQDAAKKLRAQEDTFGAWMALTMLAQLEKSIGRYTAALAWQDEALNVIRKAKTSDAPFTLSSFVLLAEAFGLSAGDLPILEAAAEFMKPILLQYLAEPLTHDIYASIWIEVGEYDRAEEELNAAAAGAQLFGAMYQYSIAAHYGDLRYRQRRFDEARVQYEKALEGSLRMPFSAVGEEWIKVGIYSRLAELELADGRVDAALAWNGKALEIARSARNAFRESAILEERGMLLMRGDRLGEAEEAYKEALRIAVASHNDAQEASIEASLGASSMMAGNYGAAASHLEEAIRLYQTLNNPLAEGPLWTHLAVIHIITATEGTADGVLARARELAENSQWDIACNLVALLETWQKFRQGEATQADLSTAFNQITRSADMKAIDATGDFERSLLGLMWPDGPAFTTEIKGLYAGLAYFSEGRRQLERGNNIAARQFFQKALAASPNGDLRAGYLALIGATYWREGNVDEAIRWFSDATQVLDATGDNLRADAMLAGYLGGERRAYYDVLIEALLKDHQIEQAFEVTERARARGFLRLLGNPRVKPSGPVSGLAEEAEKLRIRIANWGETSAPGESLEDLRVRYEILLSRVQATVPEYASMTSVQPLSLVDMWQEVPPDTTLIAYFVSPIAAHAWILDAGKMDHVTLPLDSAHLHRISCWAAQLGQTRNARSTRVIDFECGTDPATAEEAYAALIAPLRSKIRNTKLIVIPNGDLHYVPFTALYDPKSKHYLVEDYTLTYAPSVSSLRFLRGKESAVGGRALILGDPEAPAQSGLPGAKQEAQQVAEKFHASAKVGKEARESLLYHLDGKVDLLHIAAHAGYDAKSPRFSAVYLAADDEKNGRLDVDEILSDLDLSGVNLVVLSACQSAVGKRSGGDDIIGLTRALLYAGTPGVVSTLWRIDDEATPPLIGKFYTHLLAGDTAAEALRGAQLELLRDPRYAHPHFWAAFSLTGNPMGKWTQ
jgi:CHAT domain-containing protein/tetratricopeptide (TPR) repeat protein